MRTQNYEPVNSYKAPQESQYIALSDVPVYDHNISSYLGGFPPGQYPTLAYTPYAYQEQPYTDSTIYRPDPSSSPTSSSRETEIGAAWYPSHRTDPAYYQTHATGYVNPAFSPYSPSPSCQLAPIHPLPPARVHTDPPMVTSHTGADRAYPMLRSNTEPGHTSYVTAPYSRKTSRSLSANAQSHFTMNAFQGNPSAEDRPYHCDVCSTSFQRNHDLKRHKRIHLDVKPFPCPGCEKRFTRKDALRRHLLVKQHPNVSLEVPTMTRSVSARPNTTTSKWTENPIGVSHPLYTEPSVMAPVTNSPYSMSPKSRASSSSTLSSPAPKTKLNVGNEGLLYPSKEEDVDHLSPLSSFSSQSSPHL